MTMPIQARARSTFCAFGAVLLGAVPWSVSALAHNWPTAGADLNNSHYQDAETQISPRTVSNLRLKWKFTTAGDVTAIPAVVDGYVYFPDSAGFLYKVNAATGQQIWSTKIGDSTGVAGDFARGTPAISGNRLIIGSQTGRFFAPQNG